MRGFISIAIVTIFLSACGGSGGSSTSEQPTPPVTPQTDTIPPVITVTGDAVINHEQGTPFTDPGANATDETDGAVTVVISGEVGSEAQTYTLTYSATDAAGNTSTVTRDVIVADTVAPIITLNGQSLVTMTQGDSYVEAGATATDLVDGDVSVEISGTVNSDIAADYSIVYQAIDQAGNQSSISRTVRVEANGASGDLQVLSVGQASSRWEAGLNAFDAAIEFAECNNDNGAGCPSINWNVIDDPERGSVLEIQHVESAALAGFFVKTQSPANLSQYREGALLFDLKTISGDGRYTMKLDCVFPCTSGEQTINFIVDDSWNQIIVPLAELESAGLNLQSVDTGIVIWASSHDNNVFRLDNVRYATTYTGESSISGSGPVAPVPDVQYNITQYGAGSISDTINPAGHLCVFDFGNWIYNAGVVEPGIAGCDTTTGTPLGEPSPLFPQVTGAASDVPVASHRWWGSVSFMGEMSIGDANHAAYITPDPITARVSNRGFRMMGIPAGLNVYGIDFGYRIPDPFSEVFDGIGIANDSFDNMQAFASSSSDGSVTVEWQSQQQKIMTATFVHGSPYVFVDVFAGDLQLKTLREDGGEKGIYFQDENSLGLWTSVSGNSNYYLVSGAGETAFEDVQSNLISVSNATKSYTIALMPTTNGAPSAEMISLVQQYADNRIGSVQIDYQINPISNAVEITHQYLNAVNEPVETLAGMQPLHWKHATSQLSFSDYQVRSARGITRYAIQQSFSYELPHVGVLPALPTFAEELDIEKLTLMVDEFVDLPTEQWNTYTDTYWSGKSYGKVAELLAIADSVGLEQQKQAMLTWLKGELEDWFNAETNGNLDSNKYFVYDDTWNTLLGMEESFFAHQMLNDHHFHYGYFVRAAAEVCRHDASWCSDDNYGPMVELLIRDYAGGRDDPMFPYLRHFDPANGFSWASGNVNFVRGNNNESTSEAANAYGAMILYGLITGKEDIKDRGIYLHASTSASFWQYWNNIDGYVSSNSSSADAQNNNFPEGYEQITTSIVWGDGAVFSTWFSAAYAHILGIQGLPTNPLNLHIGIYPDYLADYVDVGLFESGNGMPSGLVADQWRDIWWNIWAMTEPEASITDYDSISAHAPGAYVPEAGETKAHTYHWIQTFKTLGHMAMGTGDLTADYPTAVAFDNNGVKTYVVYNYTIAPLIVRFSNGVEVQAAPSGFTVFRNQTD